MIMQVVAAIALGSNLDSSFGGPEPTLHEAVRCIGELGRVLAVSTLRKTEPMEVVEQPRFLNGTLLLSTALPAPELMHALLEIERGMGRVREGLLPKGPRVLDLDLLLYDNAIMSTKDLTLPHPALHRRAFVLEPMVEIAPDLIHPVLGMSMRKLLEKLREEEPLHPLGKPL